MVVRKVLPLCTDVQPEVAGTSSHKFFIGKLWFWVPAISVFDRSLWNPAFVSSKAL